MTDGDPAEKEGQSSKQYQALHIEPSRNASFVFILVRNSVRRQLQPLQDLFVVVSDIVAAAARDENGVAGAFVYVAV